MRIVNEVMWPEDRRVWYSELGKASVWFLGVLIVLVLMLLLAPEGKADSVPLGQVSSYLTRNSSLPLTGGVGVELAENLLMAQGKAWGNTWQTGSLQASEDAVLRVISLYIGGVSRISDACCSLVWAQSNTAVDVTLSSGFGPAVLNLGERPVTTPEPATWASLFLGALAIGLMRWSHRPTIGQRMRTRLREYRAIRLS